jgi:hypothetical protein
VVTQRGRAASPSDNAARPRGPEAAGSGFYGLPPNWRWLLPVAVTAATAAWLAGVTSGLATGGLRVLLMVCGAVFTATAAGVPLWQQARASQARADAVAAAQRARAAMRVAMQDALDPFAALLAQLATARPRQKPLLHGEAIQLALTTIAQVSDPDEVSRPGGPRRLRVCYFALDPGPPRRLVPQMYAGRSGAPCVSFDQSTRAGQFLLHIAGDGWTVIENIGQLRAPVWWDEEHQYRAFAAGPVRGARDEPVGLLVVDALTPDDLARLDLPLVRLIARLLSLALQL